VDLGRSYGMHLTVVGHESLGFDRVGVGGDSPYTAGVSVGNGVLGKDGLCGM